MTYFGVAVLFIISCHYVKKHYEKENKDLKMQIKKFVNDEWLSMSYKTNNIEENLPVPRIEVRWHDELWETDFLGKPNFDALCDLCLVTKFGDDIRYETLNRTKTSNILQRNELGIPSRMEQDAYALIYQLKISCFVTYRESYRTLEFPEDHSYLSQSVRKIIQEDKLH